MQTAPIETVESAFARLHPRVQRQLWHMQWSHLRPLQVQAIQAIMTADAPVLLSTSTASGKTEAAFLPILSQLLDSPESSVRALYIGPLRALINDQFRRLEALCEDLEIPVHRWHGDIGATAKRKLIEQPKGVLLLTPESLESLFINRSPHLSRLFGGLQFVVIDELHVFLGKERGRHLQSLLARLERFTKSPARRIGLSATISQQEGQPAPDEAACHLLSPRDSHQVICITDRSTKPLGYRVYAHRESAQAAAEAGDDTDDLPVERAIARDVAQHFSGITSLVFANTRGQVEGYADLCRVLMPNNEVLVHHGSLARDIREDAEERLKNGSKAKAITAFCSSTLELGIDLGDVAAVGQIGAPPSVASLKQRLGRSGRGEDQTRVLRVYLELQESSADDDVFDRLHLPLVQTIAATELMLEGWVEPASQASCDLSTLTQQIISVIAQTGGTDAAFLYRTLCQEGAFSKVEPALFAQLLRCLGDQEKDVIEQTPTGELILGLRGEKLRKSRDFYAVFLTPEEYAVLHDGQLLGHLPVYWAPPTGEHLLFAGRRWQVVSVEEERHQIYVRPASGKKKPQFFGESAEVHPKLRQKMRDVLHSPQKYAYLDKIASQSLVEARREAERLYGKVLLPMGQGSTALLLWTGDRLALSIHLLLMAAGAKIKGGGDSSGVAIIYRHCEDELQSFMAKAAAMVVNGEELAQLLPNKQRRKYDWLLSDDLLEVSFAQDWLDVAGAQHLLTELSTSHS